MTFDPQLFVVALTAASAGLTGGLIPYLVARVKAKPDAQAQLNASVGQFVEGLQAELAGLKLERAAYKAECERTQKLNAELEVEVVRLRSWIDETVVIFQRLGVPHPPLPRMNGAARG